MSFVGHRPVTIGRSGQEAEAAIQVIHTYEGTETIRTRIVGRDITGVGAFV